MVEKRRKELLQKKEKELKEKEDLTLKIQQTGLWTTRREVKEKLDQIKCKKDKLSVLKSQLNFRRKVLNQSHTDKFVFQFSANRRVFTIEELSQNLFKLLPLEIDPHSPSNDDIINDPELLIYRRIEHLLLARMMLSGIKAQYCRMIRIQENLGLLMMMKKYVLFPY